MTIKERLAKNYRLSPEDVDLYINTILRVVDNMIHLGLPLNLQGVMKAKTDTRKATRYPQLGKNKRKIRSILTGKDKSTYICRIVNLKKIYNDGSEKRTTKKSSNPVNSAGSTRLCPDADHVPAGEQDAIGNTQQVDS